MVKKQREINRLKFPHLWWFLIGMWLGFTPSAFAYADSLRGYNATGGEIFYPFVPLIIWLIVKMSKDITYDPRQLPKGRNYKDYVRNIERMSIERGGQRWQR